MPPKNLIFVCVFHQDEYLSLFFLLLDSIQLFGNIQNDIDILVYTNPRFKKKIEESHFYQPYIHFHISTDKNTIEKSARARLDLFEIPMVQNYEKILYLDTDIIIRHSLQPIFNIITDISTPLLYVLEEGTIDNPKNFWGYHVFGKEINNYQDKSAFTTGILLFPNHSSIQQLFQDVKKHLQINTHKGFYDQGHLVYHAFKNQIYNNKILNNFAINRNNDIHSKKTILHFCGGVGNYKHKVDAMRAYLRDIKSELVRHFIAEARKIIFSRLMPLINATGEKLEGNIFTEHKQKNETNKFDHKRKNLALIALNPTMKNGLEIGFNAGFSTLLMLIANPNLHMTCVDLGEHKYTRPCFDAIEKIFPGRITLHLGDSKKIMPTIQKTDFDFVHIDGCHLVPIAESDIIHSYRITKKGGVLIFDDYNFKPLHTLWDKYVKKYNLQKLKTFNHQTPFHDIRFISHK